LVSLIGGPVGNTPTGRKKNPKRGSGHGKHLPNAPKGRMGSYGAQEKKHKPKNPSGVAKSYTTHHGMGVKAKGIEPHPNW